MVLGRLGPWLLWTASLAAVGQVVPGWFVLELAETPTARVRGDKRVRAAQSNVRGMLAARLGARAEVRETTEVVMNSLIVRTDVDPGVLAATPGVARVWPVYRLHRFLDRAAVVHRVVKAWESIGGPEKAGAGVRIGILDSGLDLTHPGFKGESFTAPEGFPKASPEEWKDLLNGKVVVYRSYDSLLGYPDTSTDNAGHGTAVAMAAAGVKSKAPLGEIQGMAPGAQLGIYKMFGGPNGDDGTTAMAMKALDDAAADGMDVVNLSWGFLPLSRVEADPLAPAVARLTARGVQVIRAIGNYGPVPMSGASPASGADVLTVGSSWTDRVFAPGVRLNDAYPFFGLPGNGPAPAEPVKAPLRDVLSVDPDGTACVALPAESLRGAIALLQAGGCTFEAKLNNAQAAGAVGAVVFAAQATPNAIDMNVGGAVLPAVMIRYRDGVAIRGVLASQVELTAELVFTYSLPFLLSDDGIASTSSRGPGPDGSIQPDLLAVGELVHTAAQKNNPNGDVYDLSGFALKDGTSFSSPLVAGAYAMLKSARPGLAATQYRSLLVNTAQPFPAFDARPAPVQLGGAGRLDALAALGGRLVMDPVSVSFGFGGQNADLSRTVRIQNLSGAAGTWKVDVDSADETKASVDPAEFSLGANETLDLRITLRGELQAGEYQGFLLFRPANAPDGERPQRVPYWYGVPTGKPAAATVLPAAPASAAAGTTVDVLVLVTDSIGASVPAEKPAVKVVEGLGTVLDVISLESNNPGYWLVRVRTSATEGDSNRFRIEVGPVVRELLIRSR